MRTQLLLLALSMTTLSLLATITPISYAAECTIVYGGGEFDCAKMTAPITPTPTKPAKTKGGLPVHAPSTTKTTPPTGPESFSLLGLIPVAAAGWYLKKKA